MAKILITGANGHLGRRLIDSLSQDHEIQAVVRSAKAQRTIARTTARTSGLNVSIINPSNARELEEAATDCTVAVHLIGMIKETVDNSYSAAHEDPANALIEVSKRTAIDRVIYVSILGADLYSPCQCLRHRAVVENALIDARCPASIIRVPMVLGERDRASRALKKRAAANRPIVFRGSSLEQPIYAGDVISAIISCIDIAVPTNDIYELAGIESVSRTELIRRAGRVIGKDPNPISLPLRFAITLTYLLEKFSQRPAMTRDMLKILDHDDAIDSNVDAERLGIDLTSLDETLRRCLISP